MLALQGRPLSQATGNFVMREALANLEDFVWLSCCLLDGHEVGATDWHARGEADVGGLPHLFPGNI